MFFKPNIRKLKENRNVKGLLKALKHKDYYIRENAAYALKEIIDSTTSMLLLKALNDKDAYTRKIVVEIIGEIREPKAIDSLIHALNDNVDDVQISAAKALTKIGDIKAVDPLIQKLKSTDNVKVRISVAEEIVKLGDPRGIELLIQMLENENFSIRMDVKKILIELGDRVIDSLIHALQYEILSRVKMEVAEILGALGDPKTITPLIQAFKDESDVAIRMTIAQAIKKIEQKNPGSLTSIIKEEPGIIDLFIQALHVNLTYSYRILPRETRDISGEIKYYFSSYEAAVKEILLKMGEPVILYLTQKLKDDDITVRKMAAEDLDKINWKPINTIEEIYYLIAKEKWDELEKKGKLAIEPLIQILMDGDMSIQERKKVAEILSKIGGESVINRSEKNKIIYLLAKQEWGALVKNDNLLYAAEVVLDELFKSGESLHYPLELLKNLFGDYTTLILDASSKYKVTTETKKGYCGAVDDATIYHYDISKGDEAIQKLCQIRTQISTNILHKVLHYKRDIIVEVAHYCAFTDRSTLSFETQRKMARDELARRGNPPYDPAIYLNKEAWRI